MHRSTALFVLAAALAVPAATAAWSVNGAFEPDTPDDVLDGRMFTDPDASAGDRVYFNALPSDRNALRSVNPNAGTLRSLYLPGGQMGMTAWLGV